MKMDSRNDIASPEEDQAFAEQEAVAKRAQIAEKKRQEYILEADSFTSTSALGREILAWLEFSNCKLIVRCSANQFEELSSELEDCKALGRVKVEITGTTA